MEKAEKEENERERVKVPGTTHDEVGPGPKSHGRQPPGIETMVDLINSGWKCIGNSVSP